LDLKVPGLDIRKGTMPQDWKTMEALLIFFFIRTEIMF